MPISLTPRPGRQFRLPRMEIPGAYLRAPAITDAPAIFANYATDTAVIRYLLWRNHRSVQDTVAFLEAAIHRICSGEEWSWCVISAVSDECIGMISVCLREREAEIGYVLARGYWGRGVMTNAARRVANFANHRGRARHLYATCHINNLASSRLLQKIGLVRAKVLPGRYVFPNLSRDPQDCLLFTGTLPLPPD